MPHSHWVLCLHGGAGVIGRDQPAARIAAYREGLAAALRAGANVLSAGGAALDAAMAAVRSMEENPLFNAGKGAVFDASGGHELDAAVMDGSTLSCGAVAGVRTIRSPIVAARAVMERTPHVLLAGTGADDWARDQGLETVPNNWFDDEFRRAQWLKAKEAARVQLDHADDGAKGTVGAVALDSSGVLAAATSTGGMTNKMSGRVGDTPLIGAGTYADNRTCAVSCTGTGEQFIRHAAAHGVHARMLWGSMSLKAACNDLVHRVLKPGDGGLIAVGQDGSYVMEYNSPGMFRGAADSRGAFMTAIWDD
ncbi:MAG TPA: isoaspartyl peptidase/L-asparaginase [Spirochaetales bacterium]|nr:isoaspartyl peptidase/L-asparaginase [Spirochaetales bacterium]